MLLIISALSLIYAAAMYAVMTSRRMLNRSSQFQYALAYCHVRQNNRYSA